MKKILTILLLILCINNLYSIPIDELSVSDEWHNLLLDDPHGKGFVTDYSKMFACVKKIIKKKLNS